MQIDTEKMTALMRRNGFNVEADALERGEAIVGSVCEVAGYQRPTEDAALAAQVEAILTRIVQRAGNMTTAAATKSCKRGGKCDGECDDCKHGQAGMMTPTMLGAYGDSWTALATTMQQRGCGLMCRPLNPCFLWALQVMLTRVSLRRLYWMLEHDDDSAELNVNAGSVADFVNILTTPLVSNKKALVAMTSAQLLPLIPAVTKVTATWTGDPVVTAVKVTLYQGLKGLTNLTLADVSAQLVQLGQTKNLSKWFCSAPNGTDGNCFVRPWPPFLGCSGSIIPDTEAVYALIETETLGGATLTGLNIEVIKAGTSDSKKWCRSCEVSVDDWGVPVPSGTWT